MAPAEVNNDNEKLVFNTLYKTKPQKKTCFKFNFRDTVRISKLRVMFRKGYEQTYTDEIFTVKERIGRQPPVYRLADLAEESVSCPYESRYHNSLKYICRGNRPSTCLQQALITSDTKQNGRFRLDDDKVSGTFTVNISSLTQNDSGSYLCGVQRNSELDVFSAVELEVEEWCCVKSTTINGTAGYPLTLQCPYPRQYQHNSKFLCKGDHRNNCTKMAVSQRRFTLQDDATSSSFMMKITALEADDAGTYWCGTDSQWRVGNYTKIELSGML
ncbi:polymeric immunoglobulin receptor-like [Haplochromis burtoni]|uniref:polymeric immunoglobulin receptor-like n=1 Tax=Haplochromis burtoni TaxID=8153 RepID=UPI001C2D644A|nr:polymeric immunoglobulin receptor-like [Haplochromis burtoni]